MRERPWLKIERFDYSPLAGRWAVVRMLAVLEADLRPPAGARLLVRRGPAVSSHGAFVSAADRRTTGAATELLWIASFAVLLEIVEYPNALFELSAPGRAAFALPAPGTLVFPAGRKAALPDRRWLPAHARRRVGAFATAVAVSTASLPASGLAAGRPAAHSIVTPAHGIVTPAHGIVNRTRDRQTGTRDRQNPLKAHGIVKPALEGADTSHALPSAIGRSGRITLTAPRVVKLESHAQVQVQDRALAPKRKRPLPKRPPDVAGRTPPHGDRDGPPHTGTIPAGSNRPDASGAAGSGHACAGTATSLEHRWRAARQTKDKHLDSTRPAIHPDKHHGTGSTRPTGGAPVSPPLNGALPLQPVPASVGAAREPQTGPAGTQSGAPFGGTSGSTSGLSGAPPASLALTPVRGRQRSAAISGLDLQAGRSALSRAVAGARRDQLDRVRLRTQPERVIRRRRRLDAVHARHLARVRGRRQPRRQGQPV